MGGPIKMKPGVVPHIFSCQPDRKRTADHPLRLTSEKRRRKAEVADILATTGCSSLPDARVKENVTPNIPTETMVQPAEVENTNLDHLSNVCSDSDTTYRSVNHKGVQVNLRPHVRSKNVSCNITIPVSHTSCSLIKLQSITIPSMRANTLSSSKQSDADILSTSVLSSLLPTTSSDYEPHLEEVNECETSNKKQMQCNALLITNYFISTNTKRYLGILNEWYWIIDLLHAQTRIQADHIKLTLMKIKVNDTFHRLGEQFGISYAQARNIFNSTVPRLAHMLKTLIYFPDPMSVRKALLIPFRANYNNVQSIIDCFEIQIQKPTNSVNQALTWSEYKKCNILKYLISSTPDGFINFVSNGYGGRISNTLITDKSGLLNVLPEGCGVMADRGFKQIETILNQKKCLLIRPPTVSSSVKSSKAEVLETKRIASLRIHIERVVRRLREYEMLKPHACVNHNLLPHMDSLVMIASALINLQTPIIKT